MIQSSRVSQDDHLYKNDAQKWARAVKDLVVDGEQRTKKYFAAYVAKICLELHVIVEKPEQGIIYKMLQQW